MGDTLGALIRNAREACGLTQAQLADKVGCQRPHISKIENDEKEPSRELLGRIVDELGLDPAQVLRIGTPSKSLVEALASP